jgi:hypothetical protein
MVTRTMDNVTMDDGTIGQSDHGTMGGQWTRGQSDKGTMDTLTMGQLDTGTMQGHWDNGTTRKLDSGRLVQWDTGETIGQ